MITNKKITYYHKTLDSETRLEKWTKYEFNDVWCFARKSITENSGLANNNDIQVRIEMKYVNDASIFNVGDIILIGTGNNINTQNDLQGREFYNVTNIAINNFGGTPHIHLGGS